MADKLIGDEAGLVDRAEGEFFVLSSLHSLHFPLPSSFGRPWFAALAIACAGVAPAWSAPAAAAPGADLPAIAGASAQARQLVKWVLQSDDNKGLPFAVIDKKNARVTVLTASGQARGSSPVLLGLARGDDSVPGIGERKMADIRPEERTTPAGRFLAEHGRNANGEDILWVDYDAAVSMHRVRANNKVERRLERLATPSAAENRISYGCINVPAAFYERVIVKTFEAQNAVVYVLPDVKPLAEVFTALH